MTLDPLIASFLDAAAERMQHLDLGAMSVADRRRAADELGNQLFRDVAQPGPDVASVRDLVVAGVPVKVYTPTTPGPHGVHVVLHGGGWWQGSIEDWISDVQARERCVGADCVVVTVEYGLAPERRFPAGLEDSYRAFRWVQDHAEEIGGRADSVSLGGISAGANLAAAVTLLLRERGDAQPALTLYEAGVFDLSTDYPSYTLLAEGYGLETAQMEALVDLYLPTRDHLTDPYVSPVRAASFDGLGPARFLTCELDPTRDTSDAFADRLAAAGVEVSRRRFDGQIHQSPVMTNVLPGARAWRQDVLDTLAHAHAPLAHAPLMEQAR